MEIGVYKTKLADVNIVKDNMKQQWNKAKNRDNIDLFYDWKKEEISFDNDGKVLMSTRNDNNHSVVKDIIHCLTAQYPKRVYNTGRLNVVGFIGDCIKKYDSCEWLLLRRNVQKLYD